MKRKFTRFLLFSFFACCSVVNGQSLKKSISQLESAKTIDELLASEQNFLKLISEKKKLHEAYYYGALNNLYLAFTDSLRTDDYCARADKFLFQLDSLAPNNSETYVLMAMSAGAKISADSRRQIKLGPVANKH